MTVVLDTNVLMSAFFFGGIPGMILQMWRAGRLQPAASPDIVEEYVAVTQRQKTGNRETIPLASR